MKKGLEIVYAYIKTLEDFDEILNLKLLKKHSNGVIKVFKLSYLNLNNQKLTLRLELNHKNKKLSFGSWDNNAMHTVKYQQFLETY